MDKYEKAALRFVNKQLRDFGKVYLYSEVYLNELPKGWRKDRTFCVIAIALRAQMVTADEVWIHGIARPIKLPPLVREFARRFDDGKYPHLEIM